MLETVKRMKKVRKEKGLSQAELAGILGVRTKAVWRWENDEGDPTGENFEEILDFLEGGDSMKEEVFIWCEFQDDLRKYEGAPIGRHEACQICGAEDCSWEKRTWQQVAKDTDPKLVPDLGGD